MGAQSGTRVADPDGFYPDPNPTFEGKKPDPTFEKIKLDPDHSLEKEPGSGY